MDFGLSEEQELLQQSARDFLAARVSARFRARSWRAATDGFSRGFHEKIAGDGLDRADRFPKRTAASGLSLLDLAVLLRGDGPRRSCRGRSSRRRCSRRRLDAEQRRRRAEEGVAAAPCLGRGHRHAGVLEESDRLDCGRRRRARRDSDAHRAIASTA